MPSALSYLLHLPVLSLWLIFFLENVIITAMVLFTGRLLHKAPYTYTAREWRICILTNILNTIVTYAGFWMWKNNIIHINTNISWMIIIDFLILFLAMDLLMFIFHYIIHKTFLFKVVHQLHHQSIDPSPIDLFVLHPIETIAFGSLWLILLTLYPFNIYAIITYLVINVIFGMIGHLGIEPLPRKIRNLPVIKYLGTSTFHHNHHQDVEHNFGFYTSIWDRLLKTYK
jgi:sterol desaturase/sphingolipid hydroxylase (fatty acid hydroxylase superfamily)